MVSITGIVIWSVGWSIGWSVGLWWYPNTRNVSLLRPLRSHFFHIEPRLLATAQSIDETKIHFVATALTCFKSNTAPLWINQGVPLTLSYPNYMLINVHSLHYHWHNPQALHVQRNTWRTVQLSDFHIFFDDSNKFHAIICLLLNKGTYNSSSGKWSWGVGGDDMFEWSKSLKILQSAFLGDRIRKLFIPSIWQVHHKLFDIKENIKWLWRSYFNFIHFETLYFGIDIWNVSICTKFAC